MIRRIPIFLIFLFTSFSLAFSGNVRLSVETGRGQSGISVGDLFYINIDVSNLNESPSAPSSIPGAEVKYFGLMSQSSRITNINGEMSQVSTAKYVLTLRAVKEGKFSFGPISVGGVKSNAVTYTIGSNSGNSGAPRNNSSGSDQDVTGTDKKGNDKPKFIGKGDTDLFMRATVSKSNAYEQEAIVYTVKLYSTYSAIKFIGASAAPKFDGFVIEESKDVSHSLTMETYNGKSYATAVIARYIIFPQMSGQLKVLGNTYTVSVDQREYYHDPFWGNMSFSTPLQLNVSPNDLVINVKALPSPKPADFCGGVGKFSIVSDLKSQIFKTNIAASIQYTVSGTGNLKYIQLPDLATVYPSELEVYTPKTDVKAEVTGNNVTGKVMFDYSFMPVEEGNFKIPKVKLVYFNPETEKYETSEANGYNITVGKGADSEKSQKNKPKRLEESLKNFKLEKLKKNRVPLINDLVFWLFFIIPLFILLIAILWVRIYKKSHADMVSYKSRRADKIAKKRLKKAYACMKKKDVDGFYDELLIALWGYLGDKLKMPTSELMRDNIRDVLCSRNVNDKTIDDFINLLDTCEFAKYSPEGGLSGMNNAYKSAVAEINEIEKYL